MKIICIYHSRDLDGWMSAAIVKKWFIETVSREGEDDLPTDDIDFLGWDYEDVIPDLTKYDKVIICNISFPRETMIQLLNQLDNNLIWIDQHFGAIRDIIGTHEINKEGKDTSTAFNGIRHIKFAACELTWKYFYSNDTIPEIVRLLGRYNCFGHKDTDEEQKVLEFQYGARQCISNYEEAYNHLVDEANEYKKGTTTVEAIHSNGSVIYKYLCTEAKQIYKKAFPIVLQEQTWFESGTFLGKMTNGSYKDRKFLCVNQERFNPIDFGIDYHKEGYDGFACFWYKDGKWMWSLYNDNGNIDCSIIAKQYECGEHKGAAGFVCDNETMLNVINK